MSTLPKEVLREMITGGNLKTAGDLHPYLKDALQEMLEAELDVELGYSKGDKKSKQTNNRRNGYTEKTIKTNSFRNIIQEKCTNLCILRF